MVKWKFDFFSGRMRKELKLVGKNPANSIRRAFAGVLRTSDEEERIAELIRLQGVGPAMVSVILTFYDPMNYGVLDFRVWRSLFGKKRTSFTEDDLLLFLKKVRKIARIHRLKAREVEKALYHQDYAKFGEENN